MDHINLQKLSQMSAKQRAGQQQFHYLVHIMSPSLSIGNSSMHVSSDMKYEHPLDCHKIGFELQVVDLHFSNRIEVDCLMR